MQEIAREVCVVPHLIANAYLVGNSASWVLVDTGIPGRERKLIEAAESRFGPGARPKAIVLTHGHGDHVGSATALADHWNVKIYAHRLERPFLTGLSEYPPLDPTAPGFFSLLIRILPLSTISVGHRYAEMPGNLDELGMNGWEAHLTPGHSPGHLAFFRKQDCVLLAGDAVATMNLDTVAGILSKRASISRPPVPATFDWFAARKSVRALAQLRPQVIGAGHGHPMFRCADELEHLADFFPQPQYGRYAQDAARTDETGVTYLPPPPFDPVPSIATGLAVGVLIAGAVSLLPGRDASAE